MSLAVCLLVGLIRMSLAVCLLVGLIRMSLAVCLLVSWFVGWFVNFSSFSLCSRFLKILFFFFSFFLLLDTFVSANSLFL